MSDNKTAATPSSASIMATGISKVVQTASSITIIIGVILGLVQLKEANRTHKLAAYPALKSIIEDDGIIKKKMEEGEADYNDDVLMPLLDPNGGKLTGRQIYYKKFPGFGEIGHHYESVGALLKLGYIDFEPLFQVVTFPDRFWCETEKFRTEVRNNNWNGPSKGLPDFWENFEYLKNRYEKERKKTIDCGQILKH